MKDFIKKKKADYQEGKEQIKEKSKFMAYLCKKCRRSVLRKLSYLSFMSDKEKATQKLLDSICDDCKSNPVFYNTE